MDKIKNFFKGVGRWFKNHVPTRRRIIQVYAALLTNANLKGFTDGQIYTGGTKNVCTPGLNCYSCPGAVAACPLGALQNSLGSSGTTTPYYILGIIALLGLALGRTICGFLCPFGLFQELLFKVKTPKAKKSAYTRVLSYLKYVLLITLVIAVPLIYHNVPAFCKYICPAGTFEGSVGLLASETNADLYSMLGYLFSWKFVILVCTVILSIFVYRGFCRFLCPLGAIYGFFNKIALLGVKLEKSKCIDCGMCISKCKMDIKHVGDHECINCGECIPVCPTKAISWKGSKLFIEPTSVAISGAEAPEKEAPALSSILSNGTTTVVADDGGEIEVAKAPALEAVTKQTPAEDTHADGVDKTVESAPQKTQKVVYKRKKSAFILEMVAWALAAALLITALVYYNTLPSAVASVGEKFENFTAKTYQTAYDGEELDLYKTYDKPFVDYEDKKPMIFVFWSSRNEAGIEYLNALGEIYEEVLDSANMVVVHVSNSDTAETVQGIINENGWNSYNLPFVQDTEALAIYERSGGTGSFPLTVFLNENLRHYSSYGRALTKAEILDEVKTVKSRTVYAAGDSIFNFTVNTYNSSYTDGSYTLSGASGKVLVINFWYTTCTPCVEELPYFERVLEEDEFKDDVVMLAIHSNNGEKPQAYIDKVDTDKNKASWADWNIIFGQDIEKANFDDFYFRKLGGKGGYPVTVIVDTEGRITKIVQGAIINARKDDLRPSIRSAKQTQPVG